MPRRLFIGDIQGCREELEMLLETLRFDPVADTLLPVGDLVNRGPDSLGALRLLKQLDARAVLGNHDLHLLHCAAGTRAPRPGDTLDAVLAADDREPLLAWLAAFPFVQRWEDAYLVHAGLHPRWRDPVAELDGVDPRHPTRAAVFATRVRHCDPVGNLPPRDDPPPGPPFRPWTEYYRAADHGGRTAVFGHWAARGLVLEKHLRGLDTGCVWGNQLTAWIPEEDRLASVRARRAYARMD